MGPVDRIVIEHQPGQWWLWSRHVDRGRRQDLGHFELLEREIALHRAGVDTGSSSRGVGYVAGIRDVPPGVEGDSGGVGAEKACGILARKQRVEGVGLLA